MNRLTRRCSQPLFGVARPCQSWLVYFQLLRSLAPRAVAELVLVRSMHRSIAVTLAAVASTLVSCASMRIGDIRVYGWALNRVTRADVERAIHADQAEHKHSTPHNDPITEVDVVSRDEIDIYHGRRLEGVWPHCVIRRVNGKWQYDGEILMTS
jgi:hypothetical protein